MYRKNESRKNGKISSEFAARLDGLAPQQMNRVIVLLNAQKTGKSTGHRQSRAERQAAIEVIRKSAEQALDYIDGVLERFGGKRLAESPDALGSIPVETTAAGINALAESEKVRAILEDQTIYPLLSSPLTKQTLMA